MTSMRAATLVLYASRNLHLRRGRTLLTVLGIALVTGVFCYLLCLAGGLRRALTQTGDAHNLIVLAEGATAESNSALTSDDVQRLKGLPPVARDPAGRAVVSPEYVAQMRVARRNDGRLATTDVVVRGVDLDVALRVRPNVRIEAGRWFRPGSNELVVGRTAAQQFQEGAIGAPVECGKTVFIVVGAFSAGGGAYESEFWGHQSNVADAYARTEFSSAAVRLLSSDPKSVEDAVVRVASAAVALRAIPERAYFATLTRNANVLEGMALALVGMMAVGAVFAAMNTMYAAVAGRTREFAVLRAIGYRPGAVLLGVFAESLALAILGGIAGCAGAAAVIALDRGTRDLVGTATFTSVAFQLQFTAASAGWSILVAIVIGLLSGFWPARTASRMSVVQALRAE
jgi:ABC-type antimicrobial peptide transport system permease subunit